jgi:hypothetical protein
MTLSVEIKRNSINELSIGENKPSSKKNDSNKSCCCTCLKITCKIIKICTEGCFFELCGCFITLEKKQIDKTLLWEPEAPTPQSFDVFRFQVLSYNSYIKMHPKSSKAVYKAMQNLCVNADMSWFNFIKDPTCYNVLATEGKDIKAFACIEKKGKNKYYLLRLVVNKLLIDNSDRTTPSVIQRVNSEYIGTRVLLEGIRRCVEDSQQSENEEESKAKEETETTLSFQYYYSNVDTPPSVEGQRRERFYEKISLDFNIPCIIEVVIKKNEILKNATYSINHFDYEAAMQKIRAKVTSLNPQGIP